MIEHRKYDAGAEIIRYDIAKKISLAMQENNVSSADLAREYKNLGYISATAANNDIRSFAKGFSSGNNGPAAKCRSFNQTDLVRLATLFDRLSLKAEDNLIAKIKKYDTRFRYPLNKNN